MSPLQAEEILACLKQHDVRYVVIEGLAAVLHGSPLPTVDVDICPSSDAANLDGLARALEQMQARIRTAEPDGVRFPFEGTFLAKVELLNLQTRFGDLDLSLVPAGTKGYDDLIQNAVEIRIHGTPVSVASLEDVIRSKRAANRPKDQRSLPLLRQFLEEIRKRQNEP